MKILAQNLKEGTLTVEDVPVPACGSNGVLVKTIYSAISVGTEKMKVKNGDMNYLQMARAKPEQVKQLLNSVSQQGIMPTYRKVMNKLDSFSPMGYSLVGEIVGIGSNVADFSVGDIVACAGAGYANHAEINYIPKNLCAKVPAGTDLKQASFATIASIAMQGFRQANAQIGENVAIIGLGLLGQILVQIAVANGCRVIGFDLDEKKCELAKKSGAYFASKPSDDSIEEQVLSLTNGYGCDRVILTVATQSNSPIINAVKIARDKATIVDIGITKMDLPWELYYHKEIDFRFSRSYGPGRYDPSYEEGGNDYPIGYVRWTEQRNMESILQLIKDGAIDFNKLITHTFKFDDASNAYDIIKNGTEDILGAVLEYNEQVDTSTRISIEKSISKNANLKLGGIGAGNYATTMLYPHLTSNKDIDFVGLSTATGLNSKDKATKLGFNYATTNYNDVINDAGINSVIIATRHNQHARMVIETLKADKNVYVEKPLAITLDELKKVTATAEAGKGTLMVGYNRRFSASIGYLKSQLKANAPYSVYYQINAGFIPKDNWYQSPEQGGRVIGEVCHFIDTVQFLIESDPVSVYASTTTTSDMPNQDNIFITIKFANNSTAVISYLADGDKNFPKEKITVFGGRTTIEFDNFKEIRVYQGGKTSSKKYMVLDKGQKNEMDSWTKAVIEGNQLIPLQSLLLTSLTSIKAIQSLNENAAKAISIDELYTPVEEQNL
jgi:predicted dehydrogenase/threonine dehydrogenase-like Zn-dependent dehydrogenase